MIDRVVLTADNLEKAKRFYQRALAPLGYQLIEEDEWELGFGTPQKTDFWVQSGPRSNIQIRVVLLAETRQQVEAFWEAGISCGRI